MIAVRRRAGEALAALMMRPTWWVRLSPGTSMNPARRAGSRSTMHSRRRQGHILASSCDRRRLVTRRATTANCAPSADGVGRPTPRFAPRTRKEGSGGRRRGLFVPNSPPPLRVAPIEGVQKRFQNLAFRQRSRNCKCRITHFCPDTLLTFQPLSANAQLIHLQLGRGEQ